MKRLLAWLLLTALALGLTGCRREEQRAAPAQRPVATITMQSGDTMRFELYPDLAPNTVANFIHLANRRFYDGQRFFRVVAGVFIQGGDPQNDGTGDPGYAIKGEFSQNGFKGNTLTHRRGVISMARPSDYDGAGSQFFIMQGSYPEYDGYYAAFGVVMDAESLATLDAIASQPVDGSYRPLAHQTIATIRVETFDEEYPDPETFKREKKKK